MLIVGVNSVELMPVISSGEVTVIGPSEALGGTVTVIDVLLLADTVAFTPLNLTTGVPLAGLKPLPLMVTDVPFLFVVPIAPVIGEKPLICGPD